MAIADVAEYAHLIDGDLEALGCELEAIRRDIEDSRGEKDRAYIQRAIAFQRCLDVAARLVIAGSRGKAGWMLGTTALALAKSIENMELGHNICHGQWDWMNDPEIHSSTWEWDMAGVSSQWRYSHNYRHHVFTNVIGMDDDLGYGVLRVSRDQQWRLSNLLQPLRNMLLAIMFEWGIALEGLHSAHHRAATDTEKTAQTRGLIRKFARQVGKDYLFFPALSLHRWRRTLTANVVANLLRNVWAYLVICCGHFPDVLHAGPVQFRTGWFVESLATQTLIIFAIRTRRVPFFRSRPGLVLTLAAFAVVAVGVALTVSPLAHQLGFTTLPWQFFTALVLFTIVYLLLVEMMKTVFYADPMHLAAAPHRTRGREHRIHRRAARFSHASRIAHPPSGPAPLPTSVPGS